MVNLKKRSLEPELLDIERPTPDRLVRFYRFLTSVNRFLGGTKAVQKSFEEFCAEWPKDRPLWILDVATGSADIPRSLIHWARRKGFLLRIVALDREEDTLRLAHRFLQGYPEISLVRGTAQALPFQEKSFDYVTSNLFFHHLNDEEALQLLCRCDALSRRGVIINDLVRRRRLYWWTKVFSLFCEPLLRHDNLLSVRKAFTFSEVERLRDRAGLDYLRVGTRFGHRFILAGERGSW